MKFPADLKLITFDLDDTLWPCMPVIIRAEKAVLEWLKQHTPRLADQHTIETLRAHRSEVTNTNPDIAHNLTLTRQISLQRLLVDAGYPADLALDAIKIFKSARNQVTPYDDVIPVLQTLGKTYRLIAVTNGNVDISQTPLANYFQYTLTAEKVGASKPDTKIFYEAMRLADMTPGQTLHIGDDPITDIQAARNAGIQGIWLNRHQHSWPSAIHPVPNEIKHLGELLTLLDHDPDG